MAQGGHHPGMDEEESEDTEDFIPLPFMDPFVMGLKKEGDEKFQAKLYQEAAAIYTMAMTWPTDPFMDTTAIAEKLFRKRATCFFKMGKYLEAIEDSERGIELADCMNNRNLLAKSIFIKMKAIVSLGDFVPALPLAVWCKHLRPNCEKTNKFLKDLKENLREEFKKHNIVINAVLLTMLRFADKMDMDNETRELALECYTELLELLDFKHLPGVLLSKAECLLNLGRCNEAKDVCANVLWLHRDNLEALELMSEITQRLKENERKKAEETKKTNATKTELPEVAIKVASTSTQDRQPFCKVEHQASISIEDPEECKANDDTALNSEDNVDEFDIENLPQIRPTNVKSPTGLPVENVEEDKSDGGAILNSGEQQCAQIKEECPAANVPNAEKKRKKNKKKKKSKKAKKKDQPKKKDSSDQAPVSNIDNDESPDEDDSQATDSVMGDPPDLSLDYSDFSNRVGEEKASFGTLPITLSMLEASKDEDYDDGDFMLVRKTRRTFPSTAKQSEITPDVKKQAGERVSDLDWISAAGVKPQSFGYTDITKPKTKSMGDFSHTSAKQIPFCSTAAIIEKPQSAAMVKISQITSQTNTPQLQNKSPSVASGIQTNAGQSKPEGPSYTLRLEEFPSLEGGTVQRPTHNSISAAGIAWRNFKVRDTSPIMDSSVPTSHRFQSEELTNDRRPEQSERPSTPVTFSQSFQPNTSVRKLSADHPSGLTGPKKIPESVIVVCVHFLQKSIQAKTCKFCEQRGMLKYATWNSNHYYWQVMRPYPFYRVPPRAVFNVCRHFATGRPCPKESCTFPHGEQETTMWTLQREGSLPTPEESLQMLRSSNAAASFVIQPAVPDNDTNIMPSSHETSGRPCAPVRPSAKATITNSNYQVGCVEAVLSQSSTADSQSTTSAWFTRVEQFERPSTPVPPSATPAMMTSVMAGKDVLPPPNLTADSSTNTTSSAWSKRLEPSGRSSTPVPSAKPAITTSQVAREDAPTQGSTKDDFTTTTAPALPTRLELPCRPSTPVPSPVQAMKIGAVPLSNSFTDPRKIPKGVFVVCDDFLWKHLKRAASIYEKSKACKGCENRLRLKYAVWSDSSKQWELIRPYPAEKVPANVAFKECTQYSTNRPCLKTPCSFAHGQQELLMWTMEREGILPSPHETLTGSSGSMRPTSAEVSSTTQPLVQLRFRPSPPGVTDGSFRLCRSCYTHERCRFGRGCLYAHSSDELSEWNQEYNRKKNEKLRKEIEEKGEVWSLEMASKILKGPEEDVN